MRNDNTNIIILFSITFFYTLLITTFLQSYLIPFLFSSENQVIKGLITLDSNSYHLQAIKLYQNMEEFGIQNWAIKYQGNFPPSVASLIYYFASPSPINILPFNSLIHSISSCILFLILRSFFNSKVSFFAVFIWILNPQSLEWTSQILKEGYFILGVFLFVLYMIKVLRVSESTNFIFKKLLFLFCILLSSFFLICLCRPYFLYFILFFNIALFLYQLIKIKPRLASISYLSYFCIIVFLHGFFLIHYNNSESYNVDNFSKRVPLIENRLTVLQEKIITCNSRIDAKKVVPEYCLPLWKNSEYVPDILESFLYKIAEGRSKAIFYAGDSLYSKKNFSSVMEFLQIAPSAIFYGLFSPLPNLWYGEASSPSMTIARNIMGFFTFFLYFTLFFAFKKFFVNKKNIPLIFLAFFCIMGCAFFALSYPNVGTIIRWRFAFYIIIVSIGFSYILNIFLKKNKVKNKRSNLRSKTNVYSRISKKII